MSQEREEFEAALDAYETKLYGEPFRWCCDTCKANVRGDVLARAARPVGFIECDAPDCTVAAALHYCYGHDMGHEWNRRAAAQGAVERAPEQAVCVDTERLRQAFQERFSGPPWCWPAAMFDFDEENYCFDDNQVDNAWEGWREHAAHAQAPEQAGVDGRGTGRAKEVKS